YQNIALKYNADGQYDHGEISINDPNANVVAFGKKKKAKTPDFSIGAKIRGLNLARLNLTDQFKDATIDADIEADIHGSNFNNALGSVSVSNFNVKGGNRDYHLSQLTINAQRNDNVHELAMNSDFGNIKVTGRYNYATLLQSLTNIVGSKLPTLPGLPKMNHNIDNDFQINAQIVKSDWLNSLLGIPLNLKRPLTLEGSVRDSNRKIEMTLNLPSFDYGKSSYERGYIRLTSPDDVLEAFAHLQQVGKNDGGTYWNIHALAEDNKLHTLLSFENNGKSNFSGIINTEANFYNNHHGMATANINIQPSTIAIGDSVWHVKPASINYYENHLTVNHLSVEHNKQHIIINGEATPNANDTLTVDLHDVDVSYILNLINFHSVEFAGKATGLAHISSLFGKPDMRGDLWVRDFKFEDGRMGILTANVALNHQKEQLDIDATAFDENDSRTYIHGYVSPQRNYIDLNIKANNTRGEFIESFCGSFMRNTNLRINGNVRVFGDLSEVNLEGNAIA
ncbi:MAG: translocation/assembly module TamB, partial [Prevotella sp.]|nr:translocation/assembly module TamB [Prevotella sp.]